MPPDLGSTCRQQQWRRPGIMPDWSLADNVVRSFAVHIHSLSGWLCRVQYAMLQQQRLEPPRGWPAPAASSSGGDKAASLGLKLTMGFEIAYARSRVRNVGARTTAAAAAAASTSAPSPGSGQAATGGPSGRGASSKAAAVPARAAAWDDCLADYVDAVLQVSSV